MELGQQHALLAAVVALAIAIATAGYWYKVDCSSDQSEIELLKRIINEQRSEISWQVNNTAVLNRALRESAMKVSQLEEENDSLHRELRQATAAIKRCRKTLSGEGKLLGIRVTTPLFSIGAAVDNPLYIDRDPYGYLD